MLNCYFKKITILHDWGDEFEKIAHQELSTPTEIYELTATPPKLDKNKNHFIFILCKTYNYPILKALYFELSHKNPSSAISIGFITGDTFTISPPYIFEIGNPCHFCKIDRPEKNNINDQRDNSWKKLLDLCKSQRKPIPVNEPTLLQKSLIFGSTFEHIKLYTRQATSQRHQDSLFQTMHTNLSNGLITEEPIPHWYMCDCMRPNL
ncbi:McbB family protein [Pseudomonas sp. COR18]|uniref:McbB family protein n=1 Tax=Pseudomonas sp. COR18 TaxID=3399680 RepID=UPI003B00EAA6